MKNEFLTLLKSLILVLIAVFLLGCGTDEDSSDKIPIVTIEIVRQEAEKVWFRLNADPTPTADTAVLIIKSHQSLDNQESEYTWIIVPKFTDSREFGLSLDEYFSWDVRIQSLIGIKVNNYPIEKSDIPPNFEFRAYRVGDPPSVTTTPKPPAILRYVWPDQILDPIPANTTFSLIFDTTPKYVTVSHGRAITDGNTVTIVGPFPRGEALLEIRWDQHGNQQLWRSFTEPDFNPPQVIQVTTFSDSKFFNDSVQLIPYNYFIKRHNFKAESAPSDTTEIILVFNEGVWFHEDVTGNIDIQTENGAILGWRATLRNRRGNWLIDENGTILDWHTTKVADDRTILIYPEEDAILSDGTTVPVIREPEKEGLITLSLANGKPLNPATTYVVSGKVTDLANEIEINLTFTTHDR